MMMPSTLNLNTPATTSYTDATQQRLPSCPPPPRPSQENMMHQQAVNDLQSIPYFPTLSSPSTPMVMHPQQQQQQQRKRSFLDHTQEHHMQQLQHQFLRPRPEAYDQAKHGMVAYNDYAGQEAASLAACVTPRTSLSSFSSIDAEMMDTSAREKTNVSYPPADGNGSNNRSSSGAAKETKRRRRSTLADEFTDSPSTASRAAFGIVQKSRSSFPRAA